MWDWIETHPWSAAGCGVLALIVVIAIRDVFFMRRHAIRHNFPVVGNLRYWLETIGPELRQYWVANDREELPFSRSERAWIYASSKGENNNFGFGTAEQIYSTGYPIIKNATFPFPDSMATWPGDDPSAIPCLKVIGRQRGRRRPWRPQSVINISAMSFGSLGERAVRALNKGAAAAHCYHNTGEGGFSPHHDQGAEVVWQIGTGYFGARDEQGRFAMERLVDTTNRHPQIRAIEVKLSQGAKPGKGGILPGKKVTAEIAAARGVKIGQDCISPNAHAEFDSVDGLIAFVEKIAERTGLPVGIKSAVGQLNFFEELAAKMKSSGRGPDYIAIDGGEGGTGAAPLTFADHVSLPFKIGFERVYRVFQLAGMASEVTWIGAGKLGFPDRALVALAMGCDLIYVAREAMISIGCIQAQRCHTDHCPAGIATQNKWLQAGLDVDHKAMRFAQYVKTFRKELLSLARACGYEHPSQITGEDIEFSTGVNRFTTLNELLGYRRDPVPFSTMRELTPM